MIPPFLLASLASPLVKLGAVACVLGVTWLHGCSTGVDQEEAKREALETSYAVAAAQAAGREAEKLRRWQGAITMAGDKFHESAKLADARFNSSLDGLRNAYTSRERMRAGTEPAPGCPAAGGPSAAYLLTAGETIAGMARDADQDRAGLMSCVEAWPR